MCRSIPATVTVGIGLGDFLELSRPISAASAPMLRSIRDGEQVSAAIGSCGPDFERP